MGNWVPLKVIGLPCKGKYFRLKRILRRENLANQNDPKLPKEALLPSGAIGFCYAASEQGIIYLGFDKVATKRPSGLQSPTAYYTAISLPQTYMDYIEIEL